MSKPNRSYRRTEGEAVEDFLLDLVVGAEDVRVVLDEVADAQQAVERAARLVAVQWPGSA